jgi:hypothetical protein
MEVASLIALFGQDSGIPLSLGDSGTLDLVFENNVVVTLEHDDPLDLLHCYVVLGNEPADARERAVVYRSMLIGNVFGHETDGATLGLDELTGELLVSRRLELSDTNVSLLRRVVEGMVNTAIAWRENLTALPRSVSDVAQACATPSMAGTALRA